MKKSIIIVFFVLGLSACGSKNELVLDTGGLSGTVQTVPQMQQIPDSQYLVYQEVAKDQNQVLDSLIIDEDVSSEAISAYVQHHFNQLKLQGYQISDELTQKSKIKIGSDTEFAPTLLKTYRIVNNLGSKLYAVQYYVQSGQRIKIVSYMTDELSHRTVFMRSLKKIAFSF